MLHLAVAYQKKLKSTMLKILIFILECSKKYSKIAGSLWQYFGEELSVL